MTAKLGIKERNPSMLCPCCGAGVFRGALECGCGARFVGEPLDETPIRVQRLGPTMISVGLLVLVVSSSLIITKWMAIAAVVVLWSSWRALKLARRDNEWYGGYRTAVATFSVTAVSSLALGAYGIAYIPKAIENYRIRQVATTQAAMHHIAAKLEEYKLKIGGGSYPTEQNFKRVIDDSLPTDYWDSSIKYQPERATLANTAIGLTLTSPVTHFELRSAGPDGVAGNDDDIIMRDGIFYTNAEFKKHIGVK